jgi:hydroxyacyl-ACP dehydratase HTD2-like protein with hotdog domain
MLPENAKQFKAWIERAEGGEQNAIAFLRQLMQDVASSAPTEELILLCRFLYTQQTGVRN